MANFSTFDTVQGSTNASLAVFVLIDAVAVIANINFIHSIHQHTKRYSHTRTHIYMIFVSCANLGIALFVMPITIVTLMVRNQPHIPYGFKLCGI